MTSPIRVGIIYSRPRVEEKHLFASFEQRGAVVTPINDDELILDIGMAPLPFDVIVERSVSTSRGLYALRLLEAAGNVVINRFHTANTSADKLLTTAALGEAHRPEPPSQVAVTSLFAP